MKDKGGQESYDLLSRKSGQEQKSNILAANLKRGQEEMVGFGVILILVAIIFIVFIASYIRNSESKSEDYEANSFIQALLQYTTSCEEENLNNLTIQKLIRKCQEQEKCYYRSMDPCKVLNSTIKSIVKESWDIGSKKPYKGYSLYINTSSTEQIMKITEGTITTNKSRGGMQDFGDPRGGEYIIILIDVYS